VSCGMSLYKHGRVWWSRIIRNGERFDRNTRCKNKPDAQRVEARWLTQIKEAGETLRPLQLKEQRKPITISQLAQRMWPSMGKGSTHEVEPRTLQYYKESVRPLIHSNLGAIMLHDITPERIEEFTQTRSTEVGPSSVNGSLRTLRRALKLAEEWKLIVKAPKIKLLTSEHRREFVISDDLLKKMLAHEDCTELLKRLIPFLIDTGLRISEALALRWEHVGLKPKQGASLGWVYVEKGKSKYAKRHVPLTARTRKVLARMHKAKAATSPFVFPAENGEQLSRHWPSEQFRTMRDAMKLQKDCVVHACRHTFCTRLGEAGADAFVIQRLAGHSSIIISQRYVHPTPERLESAIEKLSAYNLPTVGKTQGSKEQSSSL
jgi:integrase